MKFGGLRSETLTDFPGRKAAIVFCQGCNMRCPYCQNAGLVVPACYSEELEEEQVMAFLQEQVGKLDGVVISGGEPTVHRDLPEFIARVRDLGFAIKLDTNGTNPDMLRALLRNSLLDFVAMDVKGPLKNYTECTGVRINVELIRSSIWIIKNSGVEHEFRTTVVPGLHTLPELKEVANLVRGASRYVLQAFSSEACLRPDFRGRKTFDLEAVEEERAYFEKRVGSLIYRDSPDTAAVLAAG